MRHFVNIQCVGEQKYPFRLTPLPYAYDALEPFIDAQTMHLHHDAHLSDYIDKLNAVLHDHPALKELTLRELITRAPSLHEPLRTEIINYAGGVYNHMFFFDGLASTGVRMPLDGLGREITREFGSFERFRMALEDAGCRVFGSGYAWLVRGRNNRLAITTTANQQTPLRPILCLDVWEHAYYLKYNNRRLDYLRAILNLINWSTLESRFLDG